MNSLISISGKIIRTITHKDGTIDYNENHNIVTSQGDQLIADALSNVPARQPLNNSHGFMILGTGWSGSSPKNNSWVNTQVGSGQALALGYPQLQGSWGQLNGNVIWYRSIWAAGSLNASNINEACLVTAATQSSSTSCLAYAQVVPTTTVTLSDTLTLDWYITILGI
jgi:hypothetical protein